MNWFVVPVKDTIDEDINQLHFGDKMVMLKDGVCEVGIYSHGFIQLDSGNEISITVCDNLSRLDRVVSLTSLISFISDEFVMTKNLNSYYIWVDNHLLEYCYSGNDFVFIPYTILGTDNTLYPAIHTAIADIRWGESKALNGKRYVKSSTISRSEFLKRLI